MQQIERTSDDYNSLKVIVISSWSLFFPFSIILTRGLLFTVSLLANARSRRAVHPLKRISNLLFFLAKAEWLKPFLIETIYFSECDHNFFYIFWSRPTFVINKKLVKKDIWVRIIRDHYIKQLKIITFFIRSIFEKCFVFEIFAISCWKNDEMGKLWKFFSSKLLIGS